MAEVSVIVTVDTAADLERIKAACERLGLSVSSTLPRLGLLTGMVEAGVIRSLAEIPGVRAVEEERKIVLPPLPSPRR